MSERKKLEPIPGVRVKYRTDERDGVPWITATAWVDDEPKVEFAALRMDMIGTPGDPAYQAWVDATSAVFNAMLARKLGIEGIESKRQKPRYKGER